MPADPADQDSPDSLPVSGPSTANSINPGSSIKSAAAHPSSEHAAAPDPAEVGSTNSDPPNESQSPDFQNSDTPSLGVPNENPSVANTPFTTIIGGHSIAASPLANIINVDGQSISRGADPVVVAGTSVALSSNGDLILGASTVQTLLPAPSSDSANGDLNVPSAPFSTTFQGHSIEASPSAGVVAVDGQSITRGADPTVVSGTPIVLQSNGELIIGGSTVQNILPTASAPSLPTYSVGNRVLTLSSGQLIVAGTTLQPSGPGITIDGTPVSIGPSVLQIGTSSIGLPINTPALMYSVGSKVFTLSSGNLVAAGTTLKPNDLGVTIDGTPVSVGPSAVQVGTSILGLDAGATITPGPVATIAGQTYNVNQYTGGLVIAGSTLHVGQPAITISGTPISLGTSALVIGTSIIPYPQNSPSSLVATIAGQIYTATQLTNGIIIDGSTIHIGQPAITISGTPIVLQSSALIVGSSTIPFEENGPFSTQGFGGFIFSGLNGGPAQGSRVGSAGTSQGPGNASRTSGGVAPFLGVGSAGDKLAVHWGAILALLVGILVVCFEVIPSA